MLNYICPICNAQYSEKQSICSCGFEGIEYVDYFNPQRSYEQEKNELFKIYKFTKKVAYKEIEYTASKLSIIDLDENLIDEILENRGLAYVNAPNMILSEGALAFKTSVASLFADVKGAKALFLDESHVKMLFLGKHFESLTDGYFITFPALRYIWVDPENSHFHADNNVLFNKNQTELICYARMRPEEEYTVPKSVKKINKYAFFYTKHLKKLYIHKGTKIDDGAMTFYDDAIPEIIYIN